MFNLPNLPYLHDVLEPYIDEETMHVHHDGHHAAYVKNLNDALAGHDEFLNMEVEELLKNLDRVPEEIRTKVKNNAGGHYHHSIWWPMLAPADENGAREATGELLQQIEKDYGGFAAFREKFDQAASTLFGSGWVWLVWDRDHLAIASTANQDSPLSQGFYPVLGLDVWEHAYYLKYKNKRADWIFAFWNVVNWQEVARRLNRAKEGGLNGTDSH